MSMASELIRVRGQVQGVGFRPTVWRLAQQLALTGWVANDAQGVVILAQGPPDRLAELVDALQRAPPPLARIASIERTAVAMAPLPDFRISDSQAGAMHTAVTPDAALCAACRQEIGDPAARRFQYAFTNCTHCGPRLSIIQTVPYDRAATTMRGFRMCSDCAAEYGDPADRRFHAQPIACPACGPHLWLEPPLSGDPIEAARAILHDGGIAAIKALGGFHLACDATNPAAVARLRSGKRRDVKPFALMARDVETIRRYATVSPEAEAVLGSPAAPIVVLDARADVALPGIAPDLATLGFMLPSTPLHHLLLRDMEQPLVMTSGNLSDEPPCIDNEEAVQRLGRIADRMMLHDRPIACRVDDSIVRVMAGIPRVLRRARGYAPASIRLPGGFAAAPPVLAMGGELKATFCLLRDGEAVLSHHIGDLENAPTFADYRRTMAHYGVLFAHIPTAVTVDAHPDYLSTKLGRDSGLPVVAVQHHHAHLAACLAENRVPPNADPVLGIVLDGLGWGDDGTIWGGEFLLGDYASYRRVGSLKPVCMPGGAAAVREPWRNLLAQIASGIGWDAFIVRYGHTRLSQDLRRKPVAALLSMMERRVNSPLGSSCGRLFDAVAATLQPEPDRQAFEGQAAMRLEGLASAGSGDPYPFAIRPAGGRLELDPAPLWPRLFDDLGLVSEADIAWRFHAGLAAGIGRLVAALCDRGVVNPHVTVALSGGVFQNRLLFEQVSEGLARRGHPVLTHVAVPPNDGGLALGQAAVAAVRLIRGEAGG
jgi:hydrogenase maturation protein HypF